MRVSRTDPSYCHRVLFYVFYLYGIYKSSSERTAATNFQALGFNWSAQLSIGKMLWSESSFRSTKIRNVFSLGLSEMEIFHWWGEIKSTGHLRSLDHLLIMDDLVPDDSNNKFTQCNCVFQNRTMSIRFGWFETIENWRLSLFQHIQFERIPRKFPETLSSGNFLVWRKQHEH